MMNKNQIKLIIIGFILLALMATNPSIEDHRQAVMEEIKKKISGDSKQNDKWEQLGQAIGIAFGQGIIENSVTRDNYIIFSITKINFADKVKNIGFGILGKVFIQDYSKLEDKFERSINRNNNLESSNNLSNEISDITSFIKTSEFSQIKSAILNHATSDSYTVTNPYLDEFDNSSKIIQSKNWLSWRDKNSHILLVGDYVIFSFNHTASIYNTQMSTLVINRNSLEINEFPCFIKSVSGNNLNVFYQESDDTGQYLIKKYGTLYLSRNKLEWASQETSKISSKAHAPDG